MLLCLNKVRRHGGLDLVFKGQKSIYIYIYIIVVVMVIITTWFAGVCLVSRPLRFNHAGNAISLVRGS